MGNVLGSIIVHSYQTCEVEQQRQKLTLIVEFADRVIGSRMGKNIGNQLIKFFE